MAALDRPVATDYRRASGFVRSLVTSPPGADTMRLPFFFFGTLRDEGVFRAVIGRPLAAFAATHATLDGHTVERLEDWPYPRLVACPGGRAPGLLVDGFTMAEIDRMNFFEALEYQAREIAVETGAGVRRAACFLAVERMVSSGLAWRIEEWRVMAGDSARAEAEICMTEFYGRIGRHEIDAAWPEIERRAADLLALRQRARGALVS
jgi:hypothetical protein